MRFIQNDQNHDPMNILRTGIALFTLFGVTACTQQQYYEGLKAGRRSNCLEYPEPEYEDCIEETNKSYDEYQNERKEIVGN